MNWEELKPTQITSGWNMPFISINADNVISFSSVAANILGIEKGGYVGVARCSDTGKYAILRHDKKLPNSYKVSKSRQLRDLFLPDKLRVWKAAQNGKLLRIEMSPNHIDSRVNGCLAYELIDSNQ